MNVKVGEAQVTNSIAKVLQQWQNNKCDELKWHIETLGKIQDFMCRLVAEEPNLESGNSLAILLSKIVYVKDDLKNFLIEEEVYNG